MLEILKTVNGHVRQCTDFAEGCWVNLVHPTREELMRVQSQYQVEEDFLYAALDPEETSRVEVEDEQTLMIIDIPTIENKGKENPESTDDLQIFSTLPMGIVVLPNVVITICLQDTIVLRSIVEDKIKDIHTGMKTRLVLQILNRVAGMFLRNLRLIQRDFAKVERDLYDKLKNEELIRLLGFSKSLVYFSTSLKGNEVTMEKVLRGRVLKLYEDDRDLLEDALIEIRQGIEMATVISSILSGTMDAYSSVVSNNLNMIMKVLTIITIIMTIPNIVFGFYGMNISGWGGQNALPLAQYWWVPLAIALIGCLTAWFIMKHKDLT